MSTNASHPDGDARGRRRRIVIVGAGFGGLSAARTLAGQPVDVLMINRTNYHGFWPLLYQVATAGLEPEAIADPVRAMLRRYPNVDFRMGDVTGVDFQRRQVLTDGEAIPYDGLIIAAGSTNNYFGNHELAERTFGMKDIDEAEALRNQVLLRFEEAVRTSDRQRREALMTFVIVGGGPTGVELAGAFAELIRHVLRRDYPALARDAARVILVEAGDAILAAFPPKLRESAASRLAKMGVDVRLQTAVDRVEDDRVVFRDGSGLATTTVIWAAGVKASDLADRLGVPQARGGRVPVTPELHLPDREEVFVIGDMASLEDPKDGRPYPMVAQVAIQQGRQAAENLIAQWSGAPMQPFRYHDKGSMATIGRRAAVFDAYGIRMTGLIAWLGWLFVHLIYLIGFRNRMVVLTNWAYNYFTYDRGVRIITSTRNPHVHPVSESPEGQRRDRIA
jgi:NADH dehydrogenase